MRVSGVAQVRPGGEHRRIKGPATDVQVSSTGGTLAAAAKDVFSAGNRLSIPQRYVVQLILKSELQSGRLTFAPSFLAEDGTLMTWPMSINRAPDTVSNGQYGMPVDSSNSGLRTVSVPAGGSLLVEWFKGPLVIVLERLGIRLRVTHTRFIITVSPDGQEAYVYLEEGGIEVVGMSITLTAGQLWRLSAVPLATAPRIEKVQSDPATLKRLRDAARFDEGLVSPARPFYKNPVAIGAIAVGAVAAWAVIPGNCGSSCSVGVSIPIP